MRPPASLACLFLSATTLAAGADGGNALFERCAGCHQIGAGAAVGIGPPLTGIVGAPAASADDFAYSEALRAQAEAGLAWGPETLDAFLADPAGWLPGTAMAVKGVADAGERETLIDFLAAYEGEVTGFGVAPEVLALEGDAAYGEYLAGECAACHGRDAEGIPSIEGWTEARFVTALHAYKSGAREHPVMEMVASRLGESEIAALAAWFAARE